MAEEKKFSDYRFNVALGPRTQEMMNALKANTGRDMSTIARAALWLWLMSGDVGQENAVMKRGLPTVDPLADPDSDGDLMAAAMLFEAAAQRCRERLKAGKRQRGASSGTARGKQR